MTALLAFFLIGAADAAVKNPDTFVFVGVADPVTLEPTESGAGAMNSDPLANIYETLLVFKGTSAVELEPRLATAVPSRENGLVSRDGRSYRFPIRSGVRFHDGGLMTPEDVKYSLMRQLLLDPPLGGSSAVLFGAILGESSTRDRAGRLKPGIFAAADRAIAVEGGTVTVRLIRPFAPFLSVLANFGVILSKSWCAAQGDWNGSAAALARHNGRKSEESPLRERANGTGPFRLERWDRQQRTVYLSRHDGYWRGPARLRRVLLKTSEELATRQLMLETGDADSIHAAIAARSQIAGRPGVALFDDVTPVAVRPVVYFNLKLASKGNPWIGSGKLDGKGIPPDFLADKDVRKALAYSIDYDALLREAFGGRGRPAHGILPSALPEHDPSLPGYRLDPKKATEHLRRAWGGKVWERGFTLSLLHPAGDPIREAVMQMLKRNLEALNPKFRVETRAVQMATIVDHAHRKNIPIWIGSWVADYPDAHNFAYSLLHSGRVHERSAYRNEELDRLIDEAAAETDARKRRTLYRRIQEIGLDELPVIVVAEEPRIRVQRDWVRGYRFSPVFPSAPWGSYYYDLWKEEP